MLTIDSGYYTVRFEHLALHNAQVVGGAQWFVGYVSLPSFFRTIADSFLAVRRSSCTRRVVIVSRQLPFRSPVTSPPTIPVSSTTFGASSRSPRIAFLVQRFTLPKTLVEVLPSASPSSLIRSILLALLRTQTGAPFLCRHLTAKLPAMRYVFFFPGAAFYANKI